jgi:chromosome segregation ATPase
MNRVLQWFNLLGVCVLAACCAVQWQVNRQLNLRQIDLEQARLRDAKSVAARDKTIQGDIADMNDFRQRLVYSDNALKEAQATIKADDARLAQLGAQRDQLESEASALSKSLQQWKAAVAARDEARKQSDELAAKLVADRNDAFARFNQLASRYNDAADQLQQAADVIKKLAADRNDAVTKFNELADKYNALVKPHDSSTTKP